MRTRVIATLSVVVVVAAVIFGFEFKRARFHATIVPLRSLAQCEAATAKMLGFAGYQGGDATSAAADRCVTNPVSIWFETTVRNVGHTGAFLNHCDVRMFDARGDLTLAAMVGTLWLSFPAGPLLDPGRSATFVSPLLDRRGRVLAAVPSGTSRFEVACPTIDYHGKPPI